MPRLAWCVVALASCGGDPSNHIPDAAPIPDTAPPCMPSGTPVMHAGPITADQTWAAGIHEVTATVNVSGGTLTIEGCSEVRLAPNASIELAQGATALIANGTAAAPIDFVQATAGTPWGHVSAFGPAKLQLAHTTFDGGGTLGDYKTADQLGATLVVRGDATLPQLLAVDHVTVTHSSGIAVFMNSARFVPTSTDLTIATSGAYPILLGADSASDVPTGTYTSNVDDAILLQSAGTSAAFEQGRALLAEVTLHDRGIPYRVGLVPATIIVGDGIQGHPTAKLSIDAGVTMLFTPEGTSSSSRIQVRGYPDGTPQGALVVGGMSGHEVVFDSAAATRAAGDWQGLEFRNAIDPATSISYAKIRNAGGPSFAVGVCEWKPGIGQAREDGSVIISLAPGVVPTAFITNTAFENSAGVGVYRGWGVADVDFLATNTFTGIAGCLETNVPNASNACPTTPCPVN
jgi:hypothetical protein